MLLIICALASEWEKEDYICGCDLEAVSDSLRCWSLSASWCPRDDRLTTTEGCPERSQVWRAGITWCLTDWLTDCVHWLRPPPSSRLFRLLPHTPGAAERDRGPSWEVQVSSLSCISWFRDGGAYRSQLRHWPIDGRVFEGAVVIYPLLILSHLSSSSTRLVQDQRCSEPDITLHGVPHTNKTINSVDLEHLIQPYHVSL